ncbi:NF-kappa-B inhibitor-like protein 1 isoform X2 [Pristis pectinata]|uniref:NF-kappa-B inhibitor-like protein 1 isoform X2 n=1 Tax=Pristis pectinata TaxID=685728 RepID=UPI00223D1AE3|nr:NF-kappa-B inhibitor-like protein 1 isoform X2 [Pristis pectinata]
MVSRKQKKLLHYVEEGSVPKLKSYLRKHRQLPVTFAGRKGRTPLHVACTRREGGAARLLLRYGADPMIQDQKGNTPLHLAAREAVRKGERVYEDLVAPLRKYCPAAMDVLNEDGVTPREILRSMTKYQDPGTEADEASDDPGAEAEEACDTGKDHADREWYCKLFGECEDEFYQKCGRYEEDYSLPDPEPCTYDDWAERLAREYAAKRAQAEGSRRRRPSGDREREQREFQQRLEAEHQLYLERGAKKAEEVAGSRKRRYEQGCAQVFGREGAGRLGYADVPWPDPRGTVEDMVGVILHGVDRTQRDAFRRYLRQQRAVWHPDRFAQRCGGRLLEADRQRVLDTVTALSQALNRLAESIR